MGARGHYQLMPDTFKEMDVGTDITNPDQNAHAGIKYMSLMLKRYKGDKALAAAAYNAGPGAVDDYLAGKKHLPDETIKYAAHFGPLPHDTREADFANRSHPGAAGVPSDPFGVGGGTSVGSSMPHGGAPPWATHTTPQINKQGQESALGHVVDYMNVGAAPPIAVARDIHFQAGQRKKLHGDALKEFERQVQASDKTAWPNVYTFMKSAGGKDALAPSKVHELVEKTTMTGDGPGSFSDVVQDVTKLGSSRPAPQEQQTFGGKPLALQSQLSTQPHGPDVPSAVGRAVSASGPGVTAALETAPQVANIANYMEGPLKLGLSAVTEMGSDAARLLGPRIADALNKTGPGAKFLAGLAGVEQGVAPIAGIRRAAVAKGVDPNVAEQTARTFINAPHTAMANGKQIVDRIFKGLTPAQRIEVERLSENGGVGGVLNPPKLSDPGGDLTRRAADLRAVYVDMTGEQTALDLLKQTRVFDPGKYTYRGGGVYQRGPVPPELQAFFDEYRQGSMHQSAGTTAKAKTFANFDEAKPYLKDTYDPADQLLEYLTRRGASVGREQAIRQFRDLGLINDLVVLDPKTGNPIGVGKAGADAAERVGKSNAQGISAREAFDHLNTLRTARGDAPVTWTEFASMQRAVASRGKLRTRSQETERAAAEEERLAGRTQAGADRTKQRVGDALKQQLDTRVKDLDAMRVKIAKLQETAETGDREAAGRSLAAAVARRDAMALEIDAMQERVQSAAENVYGRRPDSPNKPLDALTDVYYNAVEKFGHDSPQAIKAFKELGGMERVDEPRPTIYEPVVGRIQEIYEAAKDLPPSAARGKVLRMLAGLGQRGAKGPTKIADRVGAERMLKRVQAAMSEVAAAGRDTTSLKIIQKLQATATSLERGIARDDARLYPRRAAASNPAQRAADVVLAGATKARTRAANLANAYDFARASETDVAAFESAFQDAMRGRASAGTERILDSSKRAAANRVGEVPFVDRGGDTSMGSPVLKFATARPEVVRFFQSQGATRPAAEGVGAFVDGMNRLSRMGVITNPVVHAGWNLGTHFLAAGGDPLFFAERMWTDPAAWKPTRWNGKTMSGVEWLDLAEQNNAIVHMADTHPLFGGSYARNMLDEPGMHGPGQAMNAAMTQLWAQNQRIVFEDFEKRYSVDLFRKFVEGGETPARAGIKVRQALGDYTNVSRSGIDGALRKTLLFYPWMKTAIPFWVKTLATKPQFITVPGIGIRRWNEAMGDPNAETDDLTIDLGAEPGGRRKMSFPGPQKWVKDLLDIFLPKDSDLDFIGSRLDAAWKVGQTHLAPWGYGASGVEGALGNIAVLGEPIAATYGPNVRPENPGNGNFTTLANREAPLGEQVKQIGEHYAGNLPFAGFAEGVGRTVSDLTHGDLRGAAGVTGGFQYDRGSKRDQHRINAAESAREAALNRARKMPPTARAHAIAAAQRAYAEKTKLRKTAAPVDPFGVSP